MKKVGQEQGFSWGCGWGLSMSLYCKDTVCVLFVTGWNLLWKYFNLIQNIFKDLEEHKNQH